MRRLRPLPSVDLTDDGIRDAYAFPEVPTWIRGSFVSTLDGVMRGPDGLSRSIQSPTDKRVFSMLRSGADAILVGAGTLRDEDYHPARLPIAVVSASGRLPLTLRLFAQRTESTPRTILLTTDAGLAQAPPGLLEVADVVSCGLDSVDLVRARDTLAERGLTRLHCEGGPRLLGDLATAGLLDELLLTLTPVLLGGTGDHHILDVDGGLLPPLRLRTTQVLTEDGTILIRAQRELTDA